MGADDKFKQKILIVDDSEMNRAILSEMLGDEYEILEAESGEAAVAVMEKDGIEISLMLLDIIMPGMDGFEVLEIMNKRGWIEDVPVIMISSESKPSSMERAFTLGVSDFVSRPFDALIVKRRVVNTILLYAKQKRLALLAASQIYEKEKNNRLMITILSHIVEFRNGESGLHILHVQTFTDIFLRCLVRITNKYKLSEEDITLISNASALHDIGKISIPDEILNKPGRLTDEEFTIMKTHSLAGAEILAALPLYHDEPLVKVAYEICRWHHERYDGRGYPDKLKGDEIPISAQVVALADVYDALTSERVYKKAYSHDKAVEMILNGECGTFNPLVLECLKMSEDVIKEHINDETAHFDSDMEVKNLMEEILHNNELGTSASDKMVRMLHHEREKTAFYASLSRGVQFEYNIQTNLLTFSEKGAEKLGLKECIIVDPKHDTALIECVGKKDMDAMINAVKATTPDSSDVQYECEVHTGSAPGKAFAAVRSTWSVDEPPVRTGSIGEIFFEENK